MLGVLIAASGLAAAASAQVPVQRAEDRSARLSACIGGQVRQQYEWFDNEEWGAEVPDGNGYWLQRYMVHIDARVSRRVRLYGGLKSGIELGRAGGPRPPDEDQLDVHQAFVDLSFGSFTARVGRQELSFGSQRIVAVREGPNMRQTFDGVRLIAKRGRWRADMLGAVYVSTEDGVFDDSPNTGRSLWGVYAVRSLDSAGAKGVDVYYLGYRRTNATFDQGEGLELRHSWGMRLWKASNAFEYNVEALAQTGSFARARIHAWTIAAEMGYPLRLRGDHQIGLRGDVTSGDGDGDDDRLGTFNPLFPNGAYFGLISFAGPSNHLDLHPRLTVNAGDDVVVRASWLFLWRQQVEDGLYGIPGNVLRFSEGTQSKFVGHSPGIEAEWQLTARVSLTGDASIFTAGPFIQESGTARATRYLAGWATYRF